MQTIAPISLAYTSENKSVDIEQKSMIRQEICAGGNLKYNRKGKSWNKRRQYVGKVSRDSLDRTERQDTARF